MRGGFVLVTLCLISYITLSAFLARIKYYDDDAYYANPYKRIQRNECYLNGKKSLVYGFTIIPIVIGWILLLLAIITALALVIFLTTVWIFNNLP